MCYSYQTTKALIVIQKQMSRKIGYMTTRDITSPPVRQNKVMYELVKKEHVISHMSNTILKYVPR